MSKLVRLVSYLLVFVLLATFLLDIAELVAIFKATNRAEVEILPKRAIEFIRNPDHKIQECGWIPEWAGAKGFDSYSKFDEFETLSPVFYVANSDGSLKNVAPKVKSQMQQLAKQRGTAFIPTIAMFDHQLFSQVVASDENLNRHISAIIDEVISNNYDGIDIDYEAIKLVDKEKYFALLTGLRDGLHKHDKLLSVTVLPKWGDISYTSLRETREVQNWQELSLVADEIRIMAYEYTYSRASNPGPIAPMQWMREIMDYAVTQIPRHKIVLGVHLYSYEWWVEVQQSDPEFSHQYLQFNPEFGEAGPRPYDFRVRAYTNKTVKQILFYPGVHDSYDGESIYKYRKVNDKTGKLEDRVLVYLKKEGVQQRQDLASEYNIKGICYWRLGDENGLLDT